MKRSADHPSQSAASQNYSGLVRDIGALLAAARRSSARAVNALMTTTYWEVGRRIVEFEQRGEMRAASGQELPKRLSRDLTARLGRGFSERNLEQMRLFYDGWPISQTASAKSQLSTSQTPSAESNVLSTFQPVAADARLRALAGAFPLPWSHYVRLLSVSNREARKFYETEALRGGWSVRQLDRQIASLFYDRAALSKSIGNEWYRVDLLFFHRRLRCLIVIDLKVGKFTHADAGQMHLYLNYAREHWSQPEENPPVGLILCAQKDEALAKYALEGLPNKVLAREYKLALPDEKTLARELEMTQKRLASRQK